MHYQNVRAAKFIDRPNRFIAHVELDGHTETVHVKNTGRCRELLVPGCTVYLEKGANPARKTAYDLIAVDKGGILINMDAQAPNKVFHEWAASGGFAPEVTAIRPEFVYGASRLDFCLETPRGPHLVEVRASHWRKTETPCSRTPPRSGASSTSGSCSGLRRMGLTRHSFL